MPSFEVNHYEVRAEIQRLQTPAGIETYSGRSLILISTPLEAGGHIRAALQFSTLFEVWHGRPVVGRLDAADPLFPVISAWFPIAEFSSFYDILRHERPLLLDWQMRDGSATAGFLRHLSLGTPRVTQRQEPVASLAGWFDGL